MVPPVSVVEATVKDDVDTFVIQLAPSELVTIQVGTADMVLEKLRVHEVKTPVPTVMVPTKSVPTTTGVAPQELAVGWLLPLLVQPKPPFTHMTVAPLVHPGARIGEVGGRLKPDPWARATPLTRNRQARSARIRCSLN